MLLIQIPKVSPCLVASASGDHHWNSQVKPGLGLLVQEPTPLGLLSEQGLWVGQAP